MGYPNDGNQAGNYTGGVSNVNEYRFRPGVCVLPVAEDPPTSVGELAAWSPVVTLRIHAPYRERKFTQAAAKERNPPTVAAPTDTGAFVFLGGTMTVVNNLSTSYQDLNWSVGAEYFYVEACTSKDTDGNDLGLVLGTLPFASILDRDNLKYGYSPPQLGAAAQGGRAVTTGYNAAGTIVGPGNTGALADSWNYNSQAFYPAQLFYSDLPNGGKPVTEGG